MKRTLTWLLTLVLCLTACSAVAETKVSFFTGKIETIDLLNEIIDGFNAANPGIVVEQEYQNDASSIIKVKFASGEVPDVMTTYEQEFVDQGKYMDLSDMNEWWDRLIPSMRESCTDLKTGKQYRVCTNMTMAGFFYNKEIFNELGLTPATTWDEFVQNLTVIHEKKSDVDPWFIFGKEAWHLGHLIEFIPHGYLKQSLGALECKTAMLNNDSAKLNFGAADGCMAVFAQNLLDLQAKGLINEDVLTATSDNCLRVLCLRRLVDELKHTPRAGHRVLKLGHNAGNVVEGLRVLVRVAEEHGKSTHRNTARNRHQRARQRHAQHARHPDGHDGRDEPLGQRAHWPSAICCPPRRSFAGR